MWQLLCFCNNSALGPWSQQQRPAIETTCWLATALFIPLILTLWHLCWLYVTILTQTTNRKHKIWHYLRKKDAVHTRSYTTAFVYMRHSLQPILYINVRLIMKYYTCVNIVDSVIFHSVAISRIWPYLTQCTTQLCPGHGYVLLWQLQSPSGNPSRTVSPLQMVQNAAACLVLDQSKRAHVTLLPIRLHHLPIAT